MKIGIIGTGNIGKTLALRLSEANHSVKVANSRGPETIDKEILANGAHAVTAEDAVKDVDVIILSIPFSAIKDIAPLFANVSKDTVVIDTSNYYPQRDGKIAEVEAGQIESEWVVKQIGRPIAKAWNTILAASFAKQGKVAGDPSRLAIPVAANDEKSMHVALSLVEDTGLDAVDAGNIVDSWRQQPGSPVYCTELTKDEIKPALDKAERKLLPKRRDMAIATITERFTETEPNTDDIVQINREIYMPEV